MTGIGRADRRMIAGVPVLFRFDYCRKTVAVEIDPEELGTAAARSLVKVWESVAEWAARFYRENDGWKVNGEGPGTLPETNVIL